MNTTELRNLGLTASNSNTVITVNGNYTHEYKYSRMVVVKEIQSQYTNKQGNVPFLLAQKIEKTSNLKLEGNSGGNVDILGLANKSAGVDNTYSKTSLRTFIYLIAPENLDKLKQLLTSNKDLFLAQEVSNTPIFTQEDYKRWSSNNVGSIDDYRKIVGNRQVVKTAEGETITNDNGHNMYRKITMVTEFQEDVYTESSTPFMINQEQEEFAIDMNQDGSGQGI